MGIHDRVLAAGYGQFGDYFLPGDAYWQRATTYSSSALILNLQPVTTNSGGSTITLDAAPWAYGSIGQLIFACSLVRMSDADDAILVRGGATSSPGPGTINAFSLEGVDFAGGELIRAGLVPPTAASLDLGDGANRIRAGFGGTGPYSWQEGISLDVGTRLLGGNDVDRILGAGRDIGVRVSGSIDLGGGDDLLKARNNFTNPSSLALYVGNEGSVEMGSGHDRINARTLGAGLGRSIYVNGNLSMGEGNDRIVGDGFQVNGTGAFLDMGPGDDVLLAPLIASNGRIDFGAGIDTLLLPAGTYTVVDLGAGRFSIDSNFTSEGEGFGGVSIEGLEWLVTSPDGPVTALAAGELALI